MIKATPDEKTYFKIFDERNTEKRYLSEFSENFLLSEPNITMRLTLCFSSFAKAKSRTVSKADAFFVSLVKEAGNITAPNESDSLIPAKEYMNRLGVAKKSAFSCIPTVMLSSEAFSRSAVSCSEEGFTPLSIFMMNLTLGSSETTQNRSLIRQRGQTAALL